MESRVVTTISKGTPLPLVSLRLLVPPFQLMTASMWQVLKKRDVLNYWKVAELVSLVNDMVPELLMDKHRMQLNLGLRARYILELCRSEPPVEPDFISSHLDKMKPQNSSLVDVEACEGEEAAGHFLELIQTLIKDPEAKRDFFSEVFPVEFGPQFDNDLQLLFWEFLCRLAQLLPVPDLEQTVSWFGAEVSLLEDCVNSVSEPTDLKTLLQHHQHLGHLEQHVPPSSMGDSIFSSLSAIPTKQKDRPKEPDPPDLVVDAAVSFVDDVAVEIIAVTDYTEVELGANGEVEVVIAENFEGADGSKIEEESMVVIAEEATTREEEETPAVETETLPVVQIPSGPHDCPDCDKKFRFASSLTAHRVIHTGERPHRCHECGRRFSFRQSLDRHRHTHGASGGKRYDCGVCGEAFRSLSARTEHKKTHMDGGVFVCRRCDGRFNWETALVKHLKTHDEEEESGGREEEEEEEKDVVRREENVSVSLPPEDVDKVISLVKVRTSGRKRKPTMKIQVINLQKRMSTKRRRRRKEEVQEEEEQQQEERPQLKPLPFNCAEHSYGSTMVSSKDGNQTDASSPAFSCPNCSFQHPEEAQVQQHIHKVHATEAEEHDKPSLQEEEEEIEEEEEEEGRFSCPDCEKSFKFQSLLKSHRRIHTGEQPFLCSQCGRRFSFKQSLQRHKRTHGSGRNYDCLICGESFTSPAAQREHTTKHMENGEFLCSECGRAFAWKSALVRHLKTHAAITHGEDGVNKSSPSHRCPRCDLVFSRPGSLSRHLRTHQEDQDKEQDRPHACSCGKTFPYRAALTAHQRTHRSERPHACPQCGKAFLYRGGLLSHMKIHSEDMPFMCSHCGKRFKRERNMRKHERCHTREDVFRCSQCDKSFVYKATLTRHELTHSGERPFLCSDCGKGFFSHAELLKHERFHTGHKPFQCPTCGKRFTQSCYLTVHLRYHSGARPYACGDCHKSFLSANRLKRHRQTHTGEKPYPCLECGKGFRQSYHLKMHQRTHLMKLT